MADNTRKIDFSLEEMELVSPTPSLNLPELIEKECYKPKDGSPYLVFYCEDAPLKARTCPCCKSNSVDVHGHAANRTIHDVNVGITQVDILLAPTRYICNECGVTFARDLYSILPNRQMTRRLNEQIKRDSFVRPFVEVGAAYGYSDTTIATIFDEYVSELKSRRGPIIAPRVLGIDEKHIVNAMRAIFVDNETGQLLEMKANNKRDDIIQTIESMVDYDKNIQIVTMDMSNGYRDYVQECLPRAKIIVDKYHVYQDLYVKISRTKSKIMDVIGARIGSETDMAKKQYLSNVRDLILKNTYLFKFGQKKLAEKQSRIAAMANICETFPEFNHLRLLKESFELIYSCTDRASAEAACNQWMEYVPPTGAKKIEAWEKNYGVSAELFSEFRTFQNTILRWHTEIFNYFDAGCSETNATSEGLNHFIEQINRVGNGYSFSRLRAKALYWHLAAPRVTYSMTTKKMAVPVLGLYTGKGHMPSNIEKYETVYGIFESDEDQPKRPPVSMLSYYQKYHNESDE